METDDASARPALIAPKRWGAIALLIVHVLGAGVAGWTLTQGWVGRVLMGVIYGAAAWPLMGVAVLCLLLALSQIRATGNRLRKRDPETDVAVRLRALVYFAMGCLLVNIFFLETHNAVEENITLTFAYGAWVVWSLLLPVIRRGIPTAVRRGLDLVLGNLSIALLLAEIGLRIVSVVAPTQLLVTDATSGEIRRAAGRMEPGSIRFGFPVNRDGHYDVEFDRKARKTSRVVVSIGDSFSYGSVPHSFHFTSVCEGELSDLEVHNLGYPSIGPSDYLYLLQNEALSLEPDLVVVQLFLGNDISDGRGVTGGPTWADREHWLFPVLLERLPKLGDAPEIDQVSLAHLHRITDRAELVDQFPWLEDPLLENPSLSRDIFVNLEAKFAGWICRTDEDVTQRQNYDTFFGILEEIMSAVRGVPLAFVLIPDEFQIDDELWAEVVERFDVTLDRDLPQRRIVPWLEARGHMVLDLLPVLRAVDPLADGKRHLYHLHDTHFNVRGNVVAGKALASFVEPMLPEPPKIPITALPLTLDFHARENLGWLRSGWQPVYTAKDTSWAWSNGDSSTLELSLPASSDLQLNFRCMPFVFPESGPQRVTVVLNGTPVEELTLSERLELYSLILRQELLVDGSNTIEFRYRYARKPIEVIPGSPDNRVLAVLWHTIEFAVP